MLDRHKFIKLMMMTQSSNDGEALTALRKANGMLAGENMNWSEFISGIKTKPAPVPKGRGTTDTAPEKYSRYDGKYQQFNDPKIANMLASLMRDAKGGFRDFVESVESYWREHGYLTERQYEAITNAYHRSK